MDDVFGQSFGDQPAIVVADENTFAIAGKEVQRRLQAAGHTLVDPYVFPGRPTLYADYQNVVALEEALRVHEAIPVAVGSGTLNDIVKRAAYERDRPYMVVATAASMDGYTAFGASITKEEYKQTMTCPAPKAVVADLDVLVDAPPRMTASGYADLLGEVTAGADWLIADALEAEKIDRQVWSLVQDPLREWIGKPAELHAGDRQATVRLIEGLIISGLAMQVHQSSRPASGGEHLFSHLWEMEGLGHGDNGEPPLSREFKVGVGSVAITTLYEQVLQRDPSTLDVEAVCRAWPTREEVERAVRAAHTTPGLVENSVKESLAKYISADQLAPRLALLRERWPEMSQRVAEQWLPAEQSRTMLRVAGCPASPSEIGLCWVKFKATYSRARMIRRRYTVLDLATETGNLAECVDELFAPGSFWARDAAP